MFSAQFESAIKKYEEVREKVYEELKISFIQEKIKKKLLKQDLNTIDLLFFDQTCLESEPIHNFMSESEDKTVSDVSEASSLENPKPLKKETSDKSSKMSKYLDLEAEYSGEDEEENGGDEDLEGIIDNSVDNDIDLEHFVVEREQEDAEILSKLENKFLKKNKKRKIKSFDTVDSESMDSFPEFQSFEFEDLVEENNLKKGLDVPISFEMIAFQKPEIEDASLFNNEENAVMKISKKDESKPKAFFERV